MGLSISLISYPKFYLNYFFENCVESQVTLGQNGVDTRLNHWVIHIIHSDYDWLANNLSDEKTLCANLSASIGLS